MADPSPTDADPSVRLRARAALIAGVVFAAFVLREGWRELSRSRDRSPSIDERFASFVGPARGERRIGTLPDASDDPRAEAHRIDLEYALAPAVLVPGMTGVRLVAGWAETDERLNALAQKHRLRRLARSSDGFALFEKSKP